MAQWSDHLVVLVVELLSQVMLFRFPPEYHFQVSQDLKCAIVHIFAVFQNMNSSENRIPSDISDGDVISWSYWP